MSKKGSRQLKRKKLVFIIAIGTGVMLLTSIVGIIGPRGPGPSTDISIIDDIERKREQKLDVIDNASLDWQQKTIDGKQFMEILDQSIIDTDALRWEYTSLDLPLTYDKYKRLSINSLNKQLDALLKLKEYVQTEDPEALPLLRTEFDQLLTTSFENRRDALIELERSSMETIEEELSKRSPDESN